jgi:hypothetical protein
MLTVQNVQFDNGFDRFERAVDSRQRYPPRIQRLWENKQVNLVFGSLGSFFHPTVEIGSFQ